MKRMKNLITGTLLLILVLISALTISSMVSAEKGGTHDFKSGLMAEIFEGLGGSSLSIVTTTFLNGEWNCQAFGANKYANDDLLDENWSLAGEDLCLMFSDSKIVNKNRGGTENENRFRPSNSRFNKKRANEYNRCQPPKHQRIRRAYRG